MKTIFFLLSTICVLAQQPHIISPNGNEKYKKGDTITIRWDGVGADVPVRLEYSVDNGNSWFLIKEEVVGNSFQWLPSNDSIYRWRGALKDYIDITHFKVRAIHYSLPLSERITSPKGLGCSPILNCIWSDNEQFFVTQSKTGFEVWDVAKHQKISWYNFNRPDVLIGCNELDQHPLPNVLCFSKGYSTILFSLKDESFMSKKVLDNVIYEFNIGNGTVNRTVIKDSIINFSDAKANKSGTYVAYYNWSDSKDFIYGLYNVKTKTNIVIYRDNNYRKGIIKWKSDSVLYYGRWNSTKDSVIYLVYYIANGTKTTNTIASDILRYENNSMSPSLDFECEPHLDSLFLKTTSNRVTKLLSTGVGYNAFSWHPSKNLIAYKKGDSISTYIEIYNADIHSAINKINVGDTNVSIETLYWSPNGNNIIVELSNRKVLIVDIKTNHVIYKHDRIQGYTNDIKWQISGKLLLTVTDGILEIWNTDSDSLITRNTKFAQFYTTNGINANWLYNDKYIAIFNEEFNSVIIWDWINNVYIDSVLVEKYSIVSVSPTQPLLMYFSNVNPHKVTIYDIEQRKTVNKFTIESELYQIKVHRLREFFSNQGDRLLFNTGNNIIVTDLSGNVIDTLFRTGIEQQINPKSLSTLICKDVQGYVYFDNGELTLVEYDIIYIVDNDTSNPFQIIDITKDGLQYLPSWRFDGQQFAVSIQSKDNCYLRNVKVYTSGTKVLLGSIAGFNHTSPVSYRPNSNEIAIGGEVAIGKIQPVEYTLDESDSAFTIQMESDTTTEVNESIPPTCTLYPNPTSGELYVQGVSGTIEMYSLLGELVFLDSTSTTSERRIPTEHLPSGMYRVVCTQGKHRLSKAVVVQH